jgi:hypothetical protein
VTQAIEHFIHAQRIFYNIFISSILLPYPL